MSLLFELKRNYNAAWEAATIEFDMKHIVQHFCMQSRTSTVNPTNSNCNWVSVVWILLNKEHSPKTAVPVLHVHTLSLTHIHVLHCQDLTITANYRETLVLQERRAKTSGDKRERNWEEREKKKRHGGVIQDFYKMAFVSLFHVIWCLDQHLVCCVYSLDLHVSVSLPSPAKTSDAH